MEMEREGDRIATSSERRARERERESKNGRRTDVALLGVIVVNIDGNSDSSLSIRIIGFSAKCHSH